MSELLLRGLIFLSYLLWQTAIVTLVMCHWLAVRTLWRMTGRRVRAGLVGGWACIGILLTVGGRMSWQLRSEMEVVSLPSPGAAVELFFWSAASLSLTVLLGRKLKLLFDHLRTRFNFQVEG